MGIDSKKLEYGPWAIYAGFPSPGVGGQSYSKFLTSNAYVFQIHLDDVLPNLSQVIDRGPNAHTKTSILETIVPQIPPIGAPVSKPRELGGLPGSEA